jgi:hypothetical protein
MANNNQSAEEYIQQFVDETGNGEVLDFDVWTLSDQPNIPRARLTSEESQQRQDWKETRKELTKHYEQRYRVSFPASCEEMLRLRVAPPFLSLTEPSSRSQAVEPRVERPYLREIAAWKDFEQNVNEFQPDESSSSEEIKYADVLHYSLNNDRECSNEANEQAYIANQVLQKLQNAGLLEHKERTSGNGILGHPDLVLVGKRLNDEKKPNIWIPIQFEATHNLLLPFEMEDLVTRYCNGVQAMIRLAEMQTEAPRANGNINRPVGWSNIAHPVGQLFGYMDVNRSRFGVLSSGTRTYFMYVNDEGLAHISNAWLVGKENYLRAWCYFVKIAHAAEPWTDPHRGERIDHTPGTTATKAEESRDGSDGVALGDCYVECD